MKRAFVLIIFFFPIILAAQGLTKNNIPLKQQSYTKKKVVKYTYEEDETRLAKLMKPGYDKVVLMKELLEKKDNELLKLSELSAKQAIQHDIDSLEKIEDQLEVQLTTVQFNFIRNNPSSFLSLDGLSMILSRNAELPLYVDTITTLYKHLNKNIQNSVSGRHFKLMLTNLKNSKVGSLAPAFTVNDINNHPISLLSFRNKEYVLLDFWASWCVHCREDIPYLKELNKKYHQKGLEIIGISKDDNPALWRKAIAEDGTQNWGHILAPLADQKNDSLITNKYFVYGIPVKILIDKDGVIIGRWSSSGDENMAELKELVEKVLGK